MARLQLITIQAPTPSAPRNSRTATLRRSRPTGRHRACPERASPTDRFRRSCLGTPGGPRRRRPPSLPGTASARWTSATDKQSSPWRKNISCLANPGMPTCSGVESAKSTAISYGVPGTPGVSPLGGRHSHRGSRSPEPRSPCAHHPGGPAPRSAHGTRARRPPTSALDSDGARHAAQHAWVCPPCQVWRVDPASPRLPELVTPGPWHRTRPENRGGRRSPTEGR